MSRIVARLALVALVVQMVVSPMVARASHNADDHSDNMKMLVNVPRETEVTQSDLAIWGDHLFAANYDGFRIFDISDPAKPTLVSSFLCPASQNDISVWRNRLFLSVDGRRSTDRCGAPAAAAADEGAFEGVRVFNIKNIAKPRYLMSLPTECGSHTHTLVPGPRDSAGKRKFVYLYVSSYPSGADTPTCPASHSTVSVVRVPLRQPREAKVIKPVDVSPTDGCHDITVFMQLKIAAAACQTEGQMWDISNPAKPKVKTHIENEDITFWHTAGFTWDGKIVAFDDEFGGGSTPGCPPFLSNVGAIWFYNVSDPSEALGSFAMPRFQDTETCTAHNFNVLPGIKPYVMVASFYGGGTSVIDFTDPTSPQEIGYYDALEGTEADTWSSYFYNGYIYANDITRGVDVFEFLDPASTDAKHFRYMNPQTQMRLVPSG